MATYTFLTCCLLTVLFANGARAAACSKSFAPTIHADNTFTSLPKDLVDAQVPELPDTVPYSTAIEVVDETQSSQTQFKTEVLSLQPELSPLFCFPELVPCWLPFIVFDVTAPPPDHTK